jgi:hypothetical protein
MHDQTKLKKKYLPWQPNEERNEWSFSGLPEYNLAAYIWYIMKYYLGLFISPIVNFCNSLFTRVQNITEHCFLSCK